METSFGEKKKKNRPPSGWNEGRKVGAAGQKEKYISSRHRPRLTRTTREKFRVGLIIADDGAMRVQGTKTLSSGTRPTSLQVSDAWLPPNDDFVDRITLVINRCNDTGPHAHVTHTRNNSWLTASLAGRKAKRERKARCCRPSAD